MYKEVKMAGTTTTGKVKWDEKKYESKEKTVGRMQRGVGTYMAGSMKGNEELMEEKPRKKKK